MPLTRYALAGDIVTMNANRDLIEKGVVYIHGNSIEAVGMASDPAPPRFENAPRMSTGGTIYPGLIELHNHLAYNVLPMWKPPAKYKNRDQWRGILEYRKNISGPMAILGKKPGYTEAIVRYVECKCLLGGVTTSQGLTLSSAPGIRSKFCGVVRDVETPDDAALPRAQAKVQDVDSAEALEKKLEQALPGGVLIHLAEGLDNTAHKHFLALRKTDGSWAIKKSLVAIHAAGLRGDDWKILAKGGGAMVWSPLSNLMLYGDTADVRGAKAAGVRIALGSDWSPSGSKNLLWELKIAYLWSKIKGGIFTEQEVVEMATINAAQMLGWQDALGSIEPGKRADLLVIDGSRGNPYKRLLKSEESSIKLVVIGGVPRYGIAPLMKKFEVPTEPYGDWRLHLNDPTANAVVGTLTLAEARKRLIEGMSKLPKPPDIARAPIGGGPGEQPEWTLALEEDEGFGSSLRPLAPLTTTAAVGIPTADSIPVEDLVKPMNLDLLTVTENPELYLKALEAQPNLPAEIPKALRQLQNRPRPSR